jgi:hypothetical protein
MAWQLNTNQKPTNKQREVAFLAKSPTWLD